MSEEIPVWRDINSIRLRGRLGRDPEIRSTQGGNEVVTFRMATSERWKDKRTGEQKEKTEWHTVTSFAEQHINTARALVKGNRVELVGQIQTREWTDQSGAKRYSTEVVLGRWGASLVLVPEEERGERAAPARQPAPAGGGGGFEDDSIPFAPEWR